MSKVIAPLLSFGADGQLGQTMVYASWRGVKYVRRYVKPANPNTLAQQEVRKTFAFLREMWKFAPVQLVSAWDAFAQGRPFTGMNKYVGENVRVVRGQPDLQNLIVSPGAKGGLPPATATFVAGGSAGEIDASVTAPNIPPGWALRSAVFLACADGDPSGFFSGPWLVEEVMSPGPYEHTFDGLEAGDDYFVGAWLTWEKPNGDIAYSVSQGTVVTATP